MIIWAYVVLLESTAADAQSFSARASYLEQRAKNYDGSLTSLGLNYRPQPGTNLGLSTDLLDRAYHGGGHVSDSQINATTAVATGTNTYVEGAGSLGGTADIYARWSLSATPHAVYDHHDFGLGVRYAEYRTGRAGGINPSYLRYLDGGWALGAAVYSVRENTWITAYQAQAQYAPNQHHLAKLVLAAGKTLEDAGLVARFNSLSGEYAYACSFGVSFGLVLGQYWSQVRQEQTIGLKVGWH